MYLQVITINLLVLAVSAQTKLLAVYNMAGVTGDITFEQLASEENVTITLNLQNVTAGLAYILTLHEYRVNWDTADRCNDTNIGAALASANVTSGIGKLVVIGMALSGPRSIEGRSFVFSGADLRICSTIEANADYITAFAKLPANIGGTVVFRQKDNNPTADTLIYLDLYTMDDTLNPTTSLTWQVNSGVVKMDIDASTDVMHRCGSTLDGLYDPDGASGLNCSTDNHSNCRIGNLTAKHGSITIASSGYVKRLYSDLKLPLSGVNSIIGKSIVFVRDDNYFACANIVQYPKMTAQANFSNDGVKGSLVFTQISPLDFVQINVNLENLRSLGGGYHVHVWPVPQRVITNDVCSASSVGDHFNPFSVNTSLNYPLAGTNTPDMYEVGDLSGKFGSLRDLTYFSKNMTDPNLQLFGKNTIIGRSIVIHKSDSTSSRWVCSPILTTNAIPMQIAYAIFTYPIIGYMVFRQRQDMPYTETQIYAELDYGTNLNATQNHNWHVHTLPISDYNLSQPSHCISAGPHFNPFNVSLGGSYSTQCSTSSCFRCELGDLSGKHGRLNIRTDTGAKSKYFFSDIHLPLSGPQSIIGKSIVIHEANAGTTRIACADIKLKIARQAEVSQWFPVDSQRFPTGKISLSQDSSDILLGITKIRVELSGLNSQIAGYHIHQYPSDGSTAQSSVCQMSDVGGHLNPFSVSSDVRSNTKDMYELGDLSGKFGFLAGATYTYDVADMTMPMQGPNSVVGRSIVLHKNDTNATRWSCGNIVDVTPGATLVQARATFIGDVQGTIFLSQYLYNNGDMSNTFILINLKYQNNSITTGHNWHVHEYPVITDCNSCGSHYNPYMVNMDTPDYTNQCHMSNPLRCEMGDLSGKAGPYDIGTGKKFITDVSLNLEGKFSAAKRSIVIHDSNKMPRRIACANIEPYGSTARTYYLIFTTVAYNSSEVENKVAASIATSVDNVLVQPKFSTAECTGVTIYFLGTDKSSLQKKFSDIIASGNYALLGKYAPSKHCTVSGTGRLAVLMWTLCTCILLTQVFLVSNWI